VPDGSAMIYVSYNDGRPSAGSAAWTRSRCRTAC
jgi:hypothetical protein